MRMEWVLVKGEPQGSPFFVRSAWGAEEAFAISFSACGSMGFSPHTPSVLRITCTIAPSIKSACRCSPVRRTVFE